MASEKLELNADVAGADMEENEGRLAADIARYGDADAVMEDKVPDAGMEGKGYVGADEGKVEVDEGSTPSKIALDGVAASFVSIVAAFFRFRWRDLRLENHV